MRLAEIEKGKEYEVDGVFRYSAKVLGFTKLQNNRTAVKVEILAGNWIGATEGQIKLVAPQSVQRLWGNRVAEDYLKAELAELANRVNDAMVKKYGDEWINWAVAPTEYQTSRVDLVQFCSVGPEGMRELLKELER